MLVRINKTEEEYLNILELLCLLIATEFLVAMEYISVYTREGSKWNKRRVFWYVFLSIPAIVSLFTITLASFKYILQ